MLRFIHDIKRNAAMNMAIDEILFDALETDSVLRTYSWDNAYTTIGYFQENPQNAVRRLTGGLLVNHHNDFSYSFCSSADNWPYLYSQQETYKYIHLQIKNALEEIDISSSFAQIQNAGKNNLCVQTLYGDDLMFEGRKIAGSCMRRRGKKILVQGSIHLDLGNSRKDEFSSAFSQNMAILMKTEAVKDELSPDELEKASVLASDKYLQAAWNNKF